MKQRVTWSIPASTFAKETFNPIRSIVENMKIEPHPDKPMIALSIGDPTVFGNLRPAEEVVEAVIQSVRSGKNNGYIPCVGSHTARAAVAEYMTCPGAPVAPKDVIICSGCSCALDLCIAAVCDNGSSLLMPRPGFPIYSTLAKGYGVTSKYYDLLPDKNWEVDLDHLESQIDSTTAAIVMNNPSNPCGSVYSRQHLKDIAAIAVKYKIPIIADEIYDHFVFEGEEYHPIASVNAELPVLACGGVTKRFLVPGWRTGWIAVHDRGGALAEVYTALQTLSQRIIGSNTIVQGALPDIITRTPASFFSNTLRHVQSNAQYCYEALLKIEGLSPIQPQGAMYLMVGIKIDEFPDIKTDLEFVERMVSEQSVFCLPGKCFNIRNFFRIVLTVPEEKMAEACDRMRVYCEQHHYSTSATCKKNEADSLFKRFRVEGGESESSDETAVGAEEDDSSLKESTVSVKGSESNGIDKPLTNGLSTKTLHANAINSEKDKSQLPYRSSELLGINEKRLNKNIIRKSDVKLQKEVVEMQTAMMKDCAIHSAADLVAEMEHD